jgi:hypothetical protein
MKNNGQVKFFFKVLKGEAYFENAIIATGSHPQEFP